MPSASTTSAAFTRLQDNLKLGLTCVKEIWNYEVRDWVTGVHAADINQDGDIEVLAGSRDGRVYSLTRDGRVRWEKIIGQKAWITALVASAPFAEQQESCVVVGTRDGKIYVLNEQGEELPPPGVDASEQTAWFDVRQSILQMWLDPSQPLTVVFAAEDRCAYCFDIARNQLRWRFSMDDPIRTLCVADVDGDGLQETLIGSDNQMLYVLSSDGLLRAAVPTEQTVYALLAADIDADGQIEILAGTRSKKLFALTPTFQTKWVQALSSRPLTLSVADVNNDRQQEILVACDDSTLSIFDQSSKLVWRQDVGKRYHSLNTFDLDRDGHIEVLAGTDDSRVYALRIQLSKDLDKRIRRDYSSLGKPDITTLLDLTKEQLDLLLSILGTNYGGIDKKLSLTMARAQMEQGELTDALRTLLKLEQQRFQLLWEKDQVGYRRALCLTDLTGDRRREVVVSSHDGGLSVFNARGRTLWSEKSPEGTQIFDAQSGYFSPGHGEDLAFVTDAGEIALVNADRSRGPTLLRFPEPAACFYLLAPSPQSASEILIGTRSGKAYLYTNDFETPALLLELPSRVLRVYAPEPDEGGKYRNPELLISTSENQLFAYTRGGNRLWIYPTRSRILALCAKDLDGDGRLEVLIGTEDRNIYVLDDNGELRWRYLLYHSVLALETADIDNDGKQEILAGCADGILYAFTSIGDLIWRYEARDPIQALRVGDIDQDDNFEIVMVEENHLEVLQVVNQHDLASLLATCWERLLADREPLEALLPLIKQNEPLLRAAGLTRLATTTPLPAETFHLLGEALEDSFTGVRKVLPEALMHAYPADPARASAMLSRLFIDRLRDVRIEVVEHLEVLARYDWNAVLAYLERALGNDERTTRRAVLRKISLLLRTYGAEVRASQSVLGEALFNLLLTGAQDHVSTWIRQEAGRVLADFLNLFEEEALPYLYRLFAHRLRHEALEHTASNLASTPLRQVVTRLLDLKFEFEQIDEQAVLLEVTSELKTLSRRENAYSTDLWLLYGELLALLKLSSIEELAAYEFALKPEQFQTLATPYPHTPLFLRVGEQLDTVTRPLKAFLRRSDPNDRLSSLLESINALDALQHLVNREYGVSPLPGAPQPYLPEFIVINALLTRWQDLFHAQRNELRGHADLKCDLQSRSVHFEETVGIWLQVANSGRAPARNVKITLLSDKSFTTARPSQPQVVELDVLPANQDTGAEFVIKPLKDSVTLTFEVAYEGVEHDIRTNLYQERLDFIEHPPVYTRIANPYTTGTPLHDGRMCYGREASLDYLHDNLTRATAQTVLVLWGQRRSGKTTLLNQLAQTERLGEHIAVMIDLQNLVNEFSLNKFFFKTAYWVAKAMHKKGLPAPEVRREDFYEPSADPAFAFELFLDEVEDALHDRQLILLLDEFEELETLVNDGILKPGIFKYLRSLMQERHYIHFLLSGTHQIEKLTRDYWSVFFNIALHHRLPSRISSEGATDLITKPVSGSLVYEPQVVNKIRQLTADQPYLIHLVCRALIDHCNLMKKNYATINDVNLVLQDVLDTGTIYFDWLWDRFDAPQQHLLQIIAEGARDEGRLLDLDDIRRVSEDYGYPYQPEETAASLKTLWAEDVIASNESERLGDTSDSTRFTIANGLFRYWLRKEKPLKKSRQAPRSAENQHNGTYDAQISMARG